MVSLLNWRRCAWLALLPLYACAPLPPPLQQQPPQHQACAQQTGMTQEYCYAVARPHAANDYPVSYRVQSQEGHAITVDRHTLEARPSVQQWPQDSIN